MNPQVKYRWEGEIDLLTVFSGHSHKLKPVEVPFTKDEQNSSYLLPYF